VFENILIEIQKGRKALHAMQGILVNRLALTPSQWLPKPATSQFPHKRRSLRDLWSPLLRRGAREKIGSPWIGEQVRVQPDSRTPLDILPARVWGMVMFQFGVALYGGYFGAGIGILMLAALGFMGLRDIHEMNTLKTTLSALINLAASVWFVWAGLIDWPKAGVMTAGALAGYYLGSHYSQRISQQAVRRIITAIGFGLSAVTFWKQFLR
jgi:uncharacterized membrane protein YfcA